MISATAPGKLFLTGEWAVLRGAPAMVAAVDRLARVDVEPLAGDGLLVVESLAEGGGPREVAETASLPAGDVGAVGAVWRILGRLGARVVVDSRPFLIGERKLGLGRSAATIAAAVCARRAFAGLPLDGDVMLADALAANALFQSGQGSGADVAAAIHGGVVVVERGERELAVARHPWPEDLQLIAGWTGEPAPTVPLVTAFAAMPAPPVLPELGASARSAVEALAAADGDRLCEAIDRSGDLLVRFGDETGLPIVTPSLRRLMELARRAGAAAKPSGAGGGDCGIALAPTASVAGAVRAAWREAGIVPLDVGIAREGARGG